MTLLAAFENIFARRPPSRSMNGSYRQTKVRGTFNSPIENYDSLVSFFGRSGPG
jgi:hypothetical protein